MVDDESSNFKPVSQKNRTITYTAEPTPAKMHVDTSDVRYIEGPWGSGKTTACIMELLRLAMSQQPDKNGIRRTRWGIIRNTYPELKSTTIKSWEMWVPPTVAPVVYSTPIICRFRQELADGTSVYAEFLFLAMDRPEDVGKLLSLELTGMYVNEAREIPWEVFEAAVGRCDRYPETIKDADGKKLYGPTYPSIILDSNPPRNTHWLWEKFETGETPKGWRKFRQPPAVYRDPMGEWQINPDAENLSHLADGYYQKQLQLSEEHIRVNLAGEPGMSRKGKTIFSKFSEHKHVSQEKLLPKRGLDVLIGIDFGLTPAVVIGQLSRNGLNILDEIPASDESLEDFLDEYVLPVLRTKYNGYRVIACGDPTGGGRQSINKLTSIGVMQQRGIRTYPAVTNNFMRRKEAVDWFLSRNEGLMLDPSLTHLREALGAGYVFKEKKNSTGDVLETADKNEFSHIADALQYLCLYVRFGAGGSALARMAQASSAKPYGSLPRAQYSGIPGAAPKQPRKWA